MAFSLISAPLTDKTSCAAFSAHFHLFKKWSLWLQQETLALTSSPHQLFLNFLRIKTCCHKTKWPGSMTPYSEMCMLMIRDTKSENRRQFP
jgi:hypothetical protein